MSKDLSSASPLSSSQNSDEDREANGDAGLDSQIDTMNEVVVDGADEGDLDHSDTTTNVVIQKNDRSLAELERWFRDGRLVLDPEWQRNYVWTSKEARQNNLVVGL